MNTIVGRPSVRGCSPERNRSDRFYTFGDSLVDNGNVFAAALGTSAPLPPPGAYCQGRFSNGPVAFDSSGRSCRAFHSIQHAPFRPWRVGFGRYSLAAPVQR